MDVFLLIFLSEFLEVEPSAESPGSVILSFPKDYLGDKRTAYNQNLTVTISLPHLDKSQSSDLTACLEMVGQTVRYPQVRIIWPLKAEDLGTEPLLFEVSSTLSSVLFSLFRHNCYGYCGWSNCSILTLGSTCVWKSRFSPLLLIISRTVGTNEGHSGSAVQH